MPTRALVHRNTNSVRVGDHTLLAQIDDLPGDAYLVTAKTSIQVGTPSAAAIVALYLTFTWHSNTPSLGSANFLLKKFIAQDTDTLSIPGTDVAQTSENLTLNVAVDVTPRIFAELGHGFGASLNQRYTVKLEAVAITRYGGDVRIYAQNSTITAMTVDELTVTIEEPPYSPPYWHW